MFTYRCYSCDYKLGDGLPPIEALSADQRAAVPGSENEPGLILPEPFENMSSYSFCEFCLLVMQEDPDAFKRRGLRENENFRELGIAIDGDLGEWDYRYINDSVLANRYLLYRELDKYAMSDTLLLMFLDYKDEVKEKQEKALIRIREQEAYEQTLKYKVRRRIRIIRAWFRNLLPYHLKEGLKILWLTLTMDKNMDEEAEMDLFEDLAWENQHWQYENDINMPFAKFHLWAIGKMTKKFFRLYQKGN